MKTQQNAKKKSDNNKQQKANNKKKTEKKRKQTKEKQWTFMSVYFFLGASVESRIIQSQEPKSAGEKMTRKKKAGGNLPSFSPRFLRVRFLKHAPVPTI